MRFHKCLLPQTEIPQKLRVNITNLKHAIGSMKAPFQKLVKAGAPARKTDGGASSLLLLSVESLVRKRRSTTSVTNGEGRNKQSGETFDFWKKPKLPEDVEARAAQVTKRRTDAIKFLKSWNFGTQEETVNQHVNTWLWTFLADTNSMASLMKEIPGRSAAIHEFATPEAIAAHKTRILSLRPIQAVVTGRSQAQQAAKDGFDQ